MLQQTQLWDRQDCQIFRQNINKINSKILNDKGLFDSIIGNLQISQQNVENLSQKFKSQTMVSLELFLQVFHRMIEIQKDYEGETPQYTYMKQNIMRILIESLRLYQRNGGYLNFNASIDQFLKDDTDYYLTEQEQEKIFSDANLCEKLLNYVMTDFDKNIPQGDFDPNFFKLCWEDYAHCKQRKIDKKPWQREDSSKFNQIYRWDTVYSKIIQLIFQSNQFSLQNMSDKPKMEKSSFIQKYGLNDVKEQIKQNQIKQNQESDILLRYKHQELEEKYNLQYNQQNQEMNNTLHLFQLNEQDKVKLTPELMMQEQRLSQILGQLILKDLKQQIEEGINIHKELSDFYFSLNQACQQPNFLYQKDHIVELYIKPDGRKYLKKYITGKNITYFISGEVDHINLIRTDMADFKSLLEKELRIKR